MWSLSAYLKVGWGIRGKECWVSFSGWGPGLSPESLAPSFKRKSDIELQWLFEQSIQTQLIWNHFDKWSIISVTFQTKLSNIFWLQPLKTEDLLLHLIVIAISFDFVGQTKQAIWRHHFGLEIAMVICHFFSLHFIDYMIINGLIENIIGKKWK